MEYFYLYLILSFSAIRKNAGKIMKLKFKGDVYSDLFMVNIKVIKMIILEF